MRMPPRVAVRLAGRAGVGIARHRVVRARSLRWAVRMPLITMAVVAVMVLLTPSGGRPAR